MKLLDHIVCYGIMSLARHEALTIGLFFKLQELDVNAWKVNSNHVSL